MIKKSKKALNQQHFVSEQCINTLKLTISNLKAKVNSQNEEIENLKITVQQKQAEN